MEIPRRIVRDYMFASQILMQTNDLTDAEQEAAQKILGQLREKFAPVANCKSSHDFTPPSVGIDTLCSERVPSRTSYLTHIATAAWKASPPTL